MLNALKILRDESKFEPIKMLNSHNYKCLPSSMFKNNNDNTEDCVSENNKLTVHEEIVQNFVRVFTSQAMLKYFEVLTDLNLDPFKEETFSKKNQNCQFQLSLWERGSYSLLSNLKNTRENSTSSMQLILYFGVPQDWDDTLGGTTHYCAADDNEPLVSVNPCSNSATILFAEEDCKSFVKYINNKFIDDTQSRDKYFFTLKLFYNDLDD